MANHKSAIKRVKQTETKRMRNRSIKTRVKTEIGKAREASQGGASETALQTFRETQSIVDKAVKKGVLHKKTASRKISRLARRINTKRA